MPIAVRLSIKAGENDAEVILMLVVYVIA